MTCNRDSLLGYAVLPSPIVKSNPQDVYEVYPAHSLPHVKELTPSADPQAMQAAGTPRTVRPVFLRPYAQLIGSLL